jgi:hypothetical protein
MSDDPGAHGGARTDGGTADAGGAAGAASEPASGRQAVGDRRDEAALDHPLAEAVSAHTGALPTAAAACLVAATVLGTAIGTAGSGMFFAGLLVVVAGLTAGGGARLAWSARSGDERNRSAGADDVRTGGGAPGDWRAADRRWLRLAGAGATFVLAGASWAAGLGGGIGAAPGLVATVLHVVILSACGLAVLGAVAPQDLGWRALKTAAIATGFAAAVPYLGAVSLGGGGGGALGGVIGWLGDVAWSILLVLAWWNSPLGWGSTLQFAAAMLTGLVLVGGVALGVVVAITSLDLARLAPRTERDAFERRFERIAALCRRIALGVVAGVGLTVILSVVQAPSRLPSAASEALLAVLGASVVRVPLVAALLGVWGGLLVVKLVVVLANLRDGDLVGWLPAGLGGAAVWLGVTALLVGLGPSLGGGAGDGTGVPLTGLTVAGILGEAGPIRIAAAVGTLTAAGAFLTFLAFAALLVLHRMGAFEGPSGAGAMAVGGLSTAAIAAGVRGALPLAVVATMGAGLVAWDAGAIGATMAAETEDGTVAANPIVARVAATAGMVLLGGVVALGIVAAVAGNLRPALQVPVLLGFVAALLLGLWRLWALSSDTTEARAEDAVRIGPESIRRAPVDHPSATSILAGLLLWTIAGTIGGQGPFGAFRIGAVSFLAVRVVLGIWITQYRDESDEPDGTAAD